MKRARTRTVLLALAAAVATAGVVVAVVRASESGHRASASAAAARARARTTGAVAGAGETASAAAYLGLTPAQLRAKQRSGMSLAQIADASPGRSATGLVDTLVAARQARLSEKLPPSARKARVARLRKRIEAQLQRVPGYVGLAGSAAYLGTSVAHVRAELQAGDSLARIADATPGKSAAGLIEALVRARQAELEAALASGRIDERSESTLLATLRQRVTAEVTRAPRG